MLFLHLPSLCVVSTYHAVAGGTEHKVFRGSQTGAFRQVITRLPQCLTSGSVNGNTLGIFAGTKHHASSTCRT